MFEIQVMARDAKSALTFLKSSIDWIYKLPIDKDAKPVLDRAWTHYSLRLCDASPRVFSEWLLAMREKSLRVQSRHLRFTTTHFDFLLRKLMAYLDVTTETASPDSQVKSKPKEQPKKPSPEKTRSTVSVELKRKRTTTTPPVSRPVASQPMEVAEVNTESETVAPVRLVTLKQSKTKKRKKQKKDSGDSAIEETSPPAADNSTILEPTPLTKEVAQNETDVETASVATESTWHTLRDSPHAYGVTRVKRAIARILMTDRTCSCIAFKRSLASPDALHALCTRIVETIPEHLLEPTGMYAVGKSEYVTTLLSTLNSLDPVGCKICSIAVGSGLGIFLWILCGT